jgi:hypothetical protein
VRGETKDPAERVGRGQRSKVKGNSKFKVKIKAKWLRQYRRVQVACQAAPIVAPVV